MKVFCLYKILKYKVQIIILIALIIASILVYISSAYLFKDDNTENSISFEDDFNLNSYYSESLIKVYSNKNDNEYNVNEIYKSINNMQCYIFNFNNDEKIKYMINGDKIKIENNMQKNKFIIPNNYLEDNLMSINTYIKILNENIVKGKVKCEDYFENDRNNLKSYNINFENINNIRIKNILKRINIIFDDKGIYKIYAFDKNDKLYIDIKINKFINNYEINDYEFDF